MASRYTYVGALKMVPISRMPRRLPRVSNTTNATPTAHDGWAAPERDGRCQHSQQVQHGDVRDANPSQNCANDHAHQCDRRNRRQVTQTLAAQIRPGMNNRKSWRPILRCNEWRVGHHGLAHSRFPMISRMWSSWL